MSSAGEENGVPLETAQGGGLQEPPISPRAGKGASEPGWAVMNYQDSGVISMCRAQRTVKSTTQGLTKDVLWPSLLELIAKEK